MEAFTPEHVRAILDALGLQTIEIQRFAESTATSQQAADAIGCQLGQIVKSLCFMIEGQPLLVLASGDGMVDDRKLATLYSVGRKKVKTASPDECVSIFGYAPGGVAPFGHRTPNLTVYIDDALQRFAVVYAAAGAHNAIFEIPLEVLIEKAGGKVMNLRKDTVGD
jgi:prolyl-tRNA editing enzyme YbaK/EbsC (Cys-tRNA(Pro) deacylase)